MWNIIAFDEVDSTNRTALEYNPAGSAHRCVITARAQRYGRGRQGRTWYSGAGLGIYATIILEKKLENLPVQLLSMLTAQAIFDTVSEYAGLHHPEIDIKWPNDVLARGKKISGILGEMKTGKEGIERIAIGFSVNVNHRQEDFPPELRQSATSILQTAGMTGQLALEPVLHQVLNRFDCHLEKLFANGADTFIEGVSRNSSMVNGRQLRVQLSGGDIATGTSAGLNEDGSLQLRLDSGIEIPLYAGEIHLV